MAGKEVDDIIRKSRLGGAPMVADAKSHERLALARRLARQARIARQARRRAHMSGIETALLQEIPRRAVRSFANMGSIWSAKRRLYAVNKETEKLRQRLEGARQQRKMWLQNERAAQRSSVMPAMPSGMTPTARQALRQLLMEKRRKSVTPPKSPKKAPAPAVKPPQVQQYMRAHTHKI